MFSAKMADESPLFYESSRRRPTHSDVDGAAYDADVEAATDVESVNDSPARRLPGDSESDSHSESGSDISPARGEAETKGEESAEKKELAEEAEEEAALGVGGKDGAKGKGKGDVEGEARAEGKGAGKGKRRRCGRWEIICWVGIGGGVVMTAVGLTMLVFFLSLTQQEPVVTVEGVEITRLSISIPPQSIKMPNLDPSMVTVPNLGGIQSNVPSLGNVQDLSVPSLDLSNLDLSNPTRLGKGIQDRLSNFGKDLSNLAKDVREIGKNVTKEVAKVGKNVTTEVSKDLREIKDRLQEAIQNNFEGLRVNLNAHVNVTATVYNPNKWDGVINFLDMGIYLFGIHVSNFSLPSFELGKKQTKVANIPLIIKDFPLLSTSSSAQVRSPIAMAMKERKIKMQTFINAQGKVRVWGVSSPTYNVTVACVMTVDPNGAQTTTQECAAKPVPV